jgi:hypothetical protein
MNVNTSDAQFIPSGRNFFTGRLWEHPQGVGRGCKADKSATTTHRRPRRDYGRAIAARAPLNMRKKTLANF